MTKTVKQKIEELEQRKKEDPHFDYGIHPLRCSCRLFQKHDGKKNIPFDYRIVYCCSVPGRIVV
jgi:hypothetical protein